MTDQDDRSRLRGEMQGTGDMKEWDEVGVRKTEKNANAKRDKSVTNDY